MHKIQLWYMDLYNFWFIYISYRSLLQLFNFFFNLWRSYLYMIWKSELLFLYNLKFVSNFTLVREY